MIVIESFLAVALVLPLVTGVSTFLAIRVITYCAKLWRWFLVFILKREIDKSVSILFVHPNYDAAGGGEEVLWSIICAVRREFSQIVNDCCGAKEPNELKIIIAGKRHGIGLLNALLIGCERFALDIDANVANVLGDANVIQFEPQSSDSGMTPTVTPLRTSDESLFHQQEIPGLRLRVSPSRQHFNDVLKVVNKAPSIVENVTPIKLSLQLCPLRSCWAIKSCPRLTLLCQFIGGIIVGVEVLLRNLQDLSSNQTIAVVDTMGVPGVAPALRILGGFSRTCAYVHYPFINESTFRVRETVKSEAQSTSPLNATRALLNSEKESEELISGTLDSATVLASQETQAGSRYDEGPPPTKPSCSVITDGLHHRTTEIQTVSPDEISNSRHRSLKESTKKTWRLSIYGIYWRLLLILYKLSGRTYRVAIVNSTFTERQIRKLWTKTHVVKLFPPIGSSVDEVQALVEECLARPRRNILISVAQFRPEKNHRLQIEAFRLFVDKQGTEPGCGGGGAVNYVMFGSTRGPNDRAFVEDLQAYASNHLNLPTLLVDWCDSDGPDKARDMEKFRNLFLEEEEGGGGGGDGGGEGGGAGHTTHRGGSDPAETNCCMIFALNCPQAVLDRAMRVAKGACHTMVDEHFGIAVVKFLMQGIPVVSHPSGGPLLDICAPLSLEELEQGMGMLQTEADRKYVQSLQSLLLTQTSGHFASTAEEFADAFMTIILSNGIADGSDLQLRDMTVAGIVGARLRFTDPVRFGRRCLEELDLIN